jgi:tetratricopeptide (TPR) repeat protein
MAAADEKYGKALAASPPDWSRAPAVLVKQIRARLLSGDKAGCAELGMTQSGRAAQGMTASVTDFAAAADMCADALDDPRARLLRGRLAEAIRKVVDAGDSAMSVDDQADALRVLRELALAVQDTTSARAYAVKQRDLLDRAVAEAKTATARMTYSFPRTEVYEYLGEGAKMIPELEKLAAELPEEYDPPSRLARLQFKLGKYDEALAAAEMAMPRIYGPRKTGILELVADIHKAKGDVEAERKARQAVFDHLSSLTGAHRDDAKLTEAQAALAAVGKAPRKPEKKEEKKEIEKEN